MNGPGPKPPTDAMFTIAPRRRSTIAGRKRPVSSTSAETFSWISSTSRATGSSWKRPCGAEAGVVDEPVDDDPAPLDLGLQRRAGARLVRSAVTTCTSVPCCARSSPARPLELDRCGARRARPAAARAASRRASGLADAARGARDEVKSCDM